MNEEYEMVKLKRTKISMCGSEILEKLELDGEIEEMFVTDNNWLTIKFKKEQETGEKVIVEATE